MSHGVGGSAHRPSATRPCVAVTLLALGVGVGGCRVERVDPPVSESDTPGLEVYAAGLLGEQAAAWNAGDLDGFMAGWDPSPATTYIGSGGLIEGIEGIRGRYAPLFEPGAERDSLRFESLRVRELGATFGVVTARYVLHQGDEVTSTGPFTLVMSRIDGAWWIVHDQSAADPPPEP